MIGKALNQSRLHAQDGKSVCSGLMIKLIFMKMEMGIGGVGGGGGGGGSGSGEQAQTNSAVSTAAA